MSAEREKKLIFVKKKEVKTRVEARGGDAPGVFFYSPRFACFEAAG